MFAVDVTPLGFLDRIPFAPGPLVFVVVAVWWYLRAVRRVDAAAEPGAEWPPTRTVAFLVGMGLIAVVTLSGLASWEQTGFTIHAIIDMVVAMVAPIFLALGAPLALTERVAGPDGRAALNRVLTNRTTRAVSHPASAWVIFAVSLFGLYFSPFFRVARAHESLLQLGHLELFLAGCLLIWPAVGADPIAKRLAPGWRAVDVLFMLPFYTVFGMAMDSFTHTVATGITITDVHGAGDVIWSAGEIIGLAVAAGILYQWLFVDLGRARREEAVDADTLATQAAVWRVSRLLAKPEAVREAERAKAIEAETISASARADQRPE
jgi:putative membrane protein